MRRYYFLGTVLPMIGLGHPLAYSFAEVIDLLKANLSPKDFDAVNEVRRYLDLKNVRALLQKRRLDRHALLMRDELADQLASRGSQLPNCLYDYLDRYESCEGQIGHFDEVIALFLGEQERRQSPPFLKFYFRLERELRLLLAAFRAKRLGLKLEEILPQEELGEPFAQELVSDKEDREMVFPGRYAALGESLYRGGDPLDEQLMVARFYCRILEDEGSKHPFSLDYLIGYVVRLILADKQLDLSMDEGRGRLEQIGV